MGTGQELFDACQFMDLEYRTLPTFSGYRYGGRGCYSIMIEIQALLLIEPIASERVHARICVIVINNNTQMH